MGAIEAMEAIEAKKGMEVKEAMEAMNDIIFLKNMTVAFDHTVTKVLTTKDIKVSLGRKKKRGEKKRK